MKRTLKKVDVDSALKDIHSTFLCSICGMVALSRAGLACHKISHENRHSIVDYVNFIPDRTAWDLCQFCDKICKSDAGLMMHKTVYAEKLIFKILQNSFLCQICEKVCKRQGGFAKSSARPWPLSSTLKRWLSSVKWELLGVYA